jgi:hypothetical protein
MHLHCRHWPDAAIPAVRRSAGTLNIRATPAMNDPFIAKAAAKAANFAEISGFTIVSGQSNVIVAADDSVDLASNSLTGAEKTRWLEAGCREPRTHSYSHGSVLRRFQRDPARKLTWLDWQDSLTLSLKRRTSHPPRLDDRSPDHRHSLRESPTLRTCGRRRNPHKAQSVA